MIQSLFDQINARLKTVIPTARNINSITWYKNEIKKLLKDKPKVNKDLLKTPAIGKMFIMMYDPKTKETIPYYDVFPVILIVKMNRNGFLGLNLHYLPIKQRTELLYAIANVNTSNKRMDETTKLNITYKLLKSFSKHPYAKVCLKRYLFKQTKYINLIFPEQWGYVPFLPSESFQKESRNYVWAESLRKIKGIK